MPQPNDHDRTRRPPAPPAAVAAILLVGLVVGLAIGGSVAQAAGSSAVTVELRGPEAVEPGVPFVLEVHVAAEAPVFGMDFLVAYDTSTVAVTNVSSGGFLSTDAETLIAAAAADADTGTIDYAESRAGTETGAEGAGVLATVEAEVRTDVAAEEVTFTFEEASALDPDGDPLGVATHGVTVSVDGAGDMGDGDGDDDTTPEATEDWTEVVDQRVLDRLAEADRVPVIVRANETALELVRDELAAHDAEAIRVLTSIDGVAANASESAIRAVAEMDGVDRITYDAPVTAVPDDDIRFSVVDVTMSDTQTRPSTPVTVTATVANARSEKRSITVSLTVNGGIHQTGTATLPPDGTATVRFELRFDDPGTYRIAVGDEPAGELTVVASDDDTPGDATGGQSTGGQTGFHFSGALLALVVVMLIAVRRHRG